MLAPRRLWTGPPAAAIRDRLLAELGAEPGALWIVPTPLARDQVERRWAGGAGRRPAGPRRSSAGMISGGLVRAARPRMGRPGSPDGGPPGLFREAIRPGARGGSSATAIEASVRLAGISPAARASGSGPGRSPSDPRGTHGPAATTEPGRGRRVGDLRPLPDAPEAELERRGRGRDDGLGLAGGWPGVPRFWAAVRRFAARSSSWT